MARKKETHGTISPEEQAEIQRLLEQVHIIAQELHASSDPQQAEAALAGISGTSETIQTAFAKALSRVRDADAADVLLAMHTFSSAKESRKEARRSLIHLEGAKVYPLWRPPAGQPAVIVANPPRFWKGLATEIREQGEMQLFLCWERGIDYGEVRMLSFLLDFWRDGVKDFALDTSDRRHVEESIAVFTSKEENGQLVDCTLAEARRLVEEALSVNKWRGTTPHKDYRHYLPSVRALLFDAPDVDQDRGRTFINPELEPDEIAVNYTGAWSMGDYGLTYDLLARNNSMREELSRAEWIEQHRAWADEAKPARMELGFAYEREQTQSALWLPTPIIGGRGSARKEVELGWSLELSETPLSGTLKDMPMGTVVNKDTGRHWFWTSCTLAREEDGWRIQSITDEGARAQGLPTAELQKHIKQHEDRVQKIVRQQQSADMSASLQKPDIGTLFDEVIRRMQQTMAYDDALIVKLPLVRTVYESAFSHAMAIGAAERAAAYLARMAQRFPENRADILRQLAALQAEIGDTYGEHDMQERARRFYTLSEQALRESIEVQSTPLSYIMLAQLKMRISDEVDEAEQLLHQAQDLRSNRNEEMVIEAGFGDVASNRGQFEKALRHYGRAAELSPDYQGIWNAIGQAQKQLKRSEEAEVSFKRALQENQRDLEAYT
ncbi:MAG: tetratricopeptide repeat protein, partial [Ktedonobacteraceae bacterium]|nr:tetratricopeptide repeat protein [Ktedonobacteraceae bacterium]